MQQRWRTPNQAALPQMLPVITHRVARPHPITGRKALHAVSGSAFGIAGMPQDDAHALLNDLSAHATP